MPEIGIMEELSEEPQMFMFTDLMGIREIAFYDPFRHYRRPVWVKATAHYAHFASALQPAPERPGDIAGGDGLSAIERLAPSHMGAGVF